MIILIKIDDNMYNDVNKRKFIENNCHSLFTHVKFSTKFSNLKIKKRQLKRFRGTSEEQKFQTNLQI